MKSRIKAFLANPFVLLFGFILAATGNALKLFESKISAKMEFLKDVSWINLLLQIGMIYAIHFLAKENKRRDVEQQEKEKMLHDHITKVHESIVKEIVNDLYPKMIKQDYRVFCVLKGETYNSDTERNKVKEYFESDKHGLTVQELKELLDKHCPELPTTV